MPLLRRLNAPVVVTLVLGALTVSYAARASTFFMPDGDTGTLIAILANGVKTLATINQQLEQARKSYEETKRMVRMGEDAYDLAAGVISMNPSRIVRSFENAFPDVQYFEMEARYPNSWLHGSGNLQALMSICFAGVKARARQQQPVIAPKGDEGADAVAPVAGSAEQVSALRARDDIPECATVERQMDLHDTRTLFTNAFGLSPQDELNAVDEEASRAFVASHAVLQKGTVTAAQARALMRACEDTGSPATCQAAAHTAAVAQLDEAAGIKSELAVMNRLQAIRLEPENAKLRREEADAVYRQDQVQKGVQQLASPSVRIKADGYGILDDGQEQP
jgi:hypothetical protein